MALKPVKYIQFDEEKAALFAAGTQCLLIPVGFIVALNGILKKLVNLSSAQILLYKIGQAIGEGYAKTLKGIFEKEKIEVLKETLLREAYNAISMQAGWGKFEILKCDLEKKNIVIKISSPISGQFLKKAEYNLEKGILSGIYREITGKEIYFKIIQEKREDNFVILKTLKIIPKEILTKEKLALIGRKKLNKKIKEKTKELREKIEELEKIARLTTARELRMIELKKEIINLKKQLEEK